MNMETLEQVVERLVREHGFVFDMGIGPDQDAVNLATDSYLAGQQAERERCAKKADALGCKCMCGSEIAAAIRRGE